MRLRQEQTVFLGTLVVLGGMTYSLLTGGGSTRSSSTRGAEADFVDHVGPNVDVAVANDELPELRRELFSPPRDTRPLPPLDLVEPPRRPLAELLPPTEPGPAAKSYGKLLRTSATFETDPDLFAQGDDEDLAYDEASAGDEKSVLELLQDARDAEPLDPFENASPAERAALLASYRRQFDWIRRGAGVEIFGRIENEDRYGLKVGTSRASEPILFVEVNPVTGEEKYKSIGAPATPIDRATVEEFGFAETIANEIEVRRLELGNDFNRGDFEQALVLADYCVRHRLDAGRALEIAEELYRMCIAYDAKDPAPRLGLAACLEAGFRFEEAFAEYNMLLEAFPVNASVRVRLALLEERFLLYRSAEERLKKAVSLESASWEARSALGQFLARRGRHAEAEEHLRAAVRSAPTDPALKHVRTEVRVALADTLFALGNVSEAANFYRQAVSGDASHQRALAGQIATALVSDGDAGAAVEAAAGGLLADGQGFELLLARGIAAIQDEEFERARDLLFEAASADPLRAARPLAALGFLAMVTGNPDEATGYVERALENEPSDAFALYLKGRLLGRQFDYEGARQALLEALDLEIDFEDALVALGDMAFRLGRFEDAERYLERAVSLDAKRAEVHALRGLNFLKLGQTVRAREAFDAAVKIEPTEPTARAGLAWCAYLDDDDGAQKANNLLANLDDARRSEPDDDPWRVWAREQQERINDHVEKVEWTDNFNRTRLMNGWSARQSVGPQVRIDDGSVVIDGQFTTNGTTQVYREYISSQFVSFSADLWISAEPIRAGIFVARERPKRQETEVIGEVAVLRHSDGTLQVRLLKQGQPVEDTDMEQPVPVGQWVRLSIDRHGSASDTTVTVSIDGIPLIEGLDVPSFGGSNAPLLVGLFAEGTVGQKVLVKMDDVSIVYRGRRN